MNTWDGGPSFDINLDESKKLLKIEVVVPSDQWLAIGWGTGMIGVDMVIFQGQGNGEIKDLWSYGYWTPTIDESNDYKREQVFKDGNKY